MIPAYKATYFRECLKSVLAQSYEDYEIVILNDCSPENIKGIVDEFRFHKNWSRVRFYENERNVGAINVVHTWNKLLNLAEGEFVICMGDDDLLAPNCLEEYNVLMKKYPNLDIYHARAYIIDDNSEIVNIQEARPNWESAYSIIWHAFGSHRMQFIGDFLFRKKKLVEEGGFYNLPMARGSDWITGIICSKDTGIANAQKPIFYYRESASTITSHTTGLILMEADIKFRQWILNFLSEEPIDTLEKVYRRILIKKIPDNLHRVQTDTIAHDISFSPIKKWLFWNKRRKKYGVKFKHFCEITIFALLYYFKRNAKNRQ